MEQKYCDLHIHTSYSDGQRDVENLLEYAKQKNLNKLSITDHDCVDAYFEIKNKNLVKKYGCDILVGCEFACVVCGVPIEILGYGFDLEPIKKYLDKNGFPQSRRDRMHCQNFVNIANSLGIDVDFDYDRDYKNCQKDMKFSSFFADLIKIPKFYDALQKQDPEFVKKYSTFMRFGINNPNSIFYQNSAQVFPTAKTIVDIVHQHGGLCFLAHPYQYGENMMMVLENLKGIIDGVECYHFTSQETTKQQVLFDFCKKNNVMKSGGSDYHFIVDPKGCKDKLNEFCVPQNYFDEILKNVKGKKPLA